MVNRSISLNHGMVGASLFIFFFTSYYNNKVLADSQPNVFQKQLALFNLNNPNHDVEFNLSRGDKRLIAIYNNTYEVPGVKNSTVIKKYGFRSIDETLSVDKGKDYFHLLDSVRVYAESYNKKLLNMLGEKTGTH
jgi:hypothetical protein